MTTAALPLLTRLARRAKAAHALSRTQPGKHRNRLDHIAREAEAAGITYPEIEAEMARLAQTS